MKQKQKSQDFSAPQRHKKREKLEPFVCFAETECYCNRRDHFHRFVGTTCYTFFTSISLKKKKKGFFHLWLRVRDHNNAMGNRSAVNALLGAWRGAVGARGPPFALDSSSTALYTVLGQTRATVNVPARLRKCVALLKFFAAPPRNNNVFTICDAAINERPASARASETGRLGRSRATARLL